MQFCTVSSFFNFQEMEKGQIVQKQKKCAESENGCIEYADSICLLIWFIAILL